jgi:hypothetical protein
MTIHWGRPDPRQDVELAVALNSCADLLLKARTEEQVDEAIRANLRLWRSIRERCLRNPAFREAEELIDSADHVTTLLAAETHAIPHPRDVAFVAGRNMALASELADDARIEDGRLGLLRQWSTDEKRQRFESWLLGRIAVTSPVSVV